MNKLNVSGNFSFAKNSGNAGKERLFNMHDQYTKKNGNIFIKGLNINVIRFHE